MASVAGTYARGFADVVVEKRLDVARALQELHGVGALMKENDDLRRVWENPSIPGEQKRRVLDALTAREGFSQTVRNFVAVLIDHKRIPFFEQIVRQVEKDMDDRMGVAEAQISSARELSDPEKREIEGQVARLTGKRLRANYSRDTSLLGGAVVRVGSTIYDGHDCVCVRAGTSTAIRTSTHIRCCTNKLRASTFSLLVLAPSDRWQTFCPVRAHSEPHAHRYVVRITGRGTPDTSPLGFSGPRQPAARRLRI